VALPGDEKGAVCEQERAVEGVSGLRRRGKEGEGHRGFKVNPPHCLTSGCSRHAAELPSVRPLSTSISELPKVEPQL